MSEERGAERDYSRHRAQECLSLRRNWVPPPPSSHASVSPPLDPNGEWATLPSGWGGGGPNSDDWKECLAFCMWKGELQLILPLRTEARSSLYPYIVAYWSWPQVMSFKKQVSSTTTIVVFVTIIGLLRDFTHVRARGSMGLNGEE